jgi:hypothetical protein
MEIGRIGYRKRGSIYMDIERGSKCIYKYTRREAAGYMYSVVCMGIDGCYPALALMKFSDEIP